VTFRHRLSTTLTVGLTTACAAASAPAPTLSPPEDVRPILDRSHLIARTDTLVLRTLDDSTGTVVEVFGVEPDAVTHSITAIAHGRVTQHVEVRLDTRSFALATVTDSIQEETVALNYLEGQVQGTRVVLDSKTGRRDSVRLALPLPTGTFDRRTLGLLLRLFPLSTGARFSFPMFDSWSQRVATVLVMVQDTVPFHVAKSTVAAHRLVVQGDLFLLPRVYYVTVESPRRILRIEQDRWTWELASWPKR